MTETKAKRRGWVKNAAIIFLAVLLVLTFFSNTIMNRSLPEVAAQYPTSGSINLKIRGTGTVSANQTQKVSIAESRKVKGVAIRAGDTVEEGQALFLLAEQDSEELAAAKTTLASMELAYEKALLDASATSSGSNYDILSAQLTLEEAIERRDKAKVYDAEREPLQEALDAAAKALSDANANADLLPEKGFLDDANEKLTKAKAAQEKAKTDFSYYAELHGVSDYDGLADQIETLWEELDKLYDDYNDVLDDIAELNQQKSDAYWGLSNAEAALKNTITEAANSVVNSPRPAQQVSEIKKQYQAAKSAWDTLVNERYSDCIEIENKYKDTTFIGPKRVKNVLIFESSTEYGDNGEITNALKDTDSISSYSLDAIYVSMVWWHMTYDAAQAYVDAMDSDSGADEIQDQIDTKTRTQKDLINQIEDKEEDLNEKRKVLSDPDMQDAYNAVLEANEAVKLANDDVYRAQLNYDEAIKSPSSNVSAAQKTYDEAKKQLELLEQEYEGVGTYTEEQKNVISAEKALSSLYESQQSQNISDQKEELDMQDQKKKLDEQRELVEDLEKNASETIVYAPCSGTVASVNVSAGDTTIMNEAMAEIELTDQGHELSFEVTKEQAARVSVGDQAEIDNRWGVDITAVLVQISNSKDNPGTMKKLTFDLKGEDVVAGQSLTLSVGQKSQSYEVIIPNSALREDAQGKFVLVVKSKSTPLGNRYSVERVDVEVLAADDNNSAVKGMLTTGEFVVITSTAPLSSGDNVRLPE